MVVPVSIVRSARPFTCGSGSASGSPRGRGASSSFEDPRGQFIEVQHPHLEVQVEAGSDVVAFSVPAESDEAKTSDMQIRWLCVAFPACAEVERL